MKIARVKKHYASELLKQLFVFAVVNRNYRISEKDGFVYIPLCRSLKKREIDAVTRIGGNVIYSDSMIKRLNVKVPYDVISEELKPIIGIKLARILPTKWEKLGNILVLKLPNILKGKFTTVAEVYAKHLEVKSVFRDISGISGLRREPQVELIFGCETETIHIENRVKYKMDVSRLMFASGNIEERRRMAQISSNRETVVDLFAGIGYFSIPMAIYSKPKCIYSCEINPIAYHYLMENIRINNVGKIVQPILGDCRKVAPEGIANRVIIGYLDAAKFIPKALQTLSKKGGIIHYHEACSIDKFDRPEKRIFNAAKRMGMVAETIKFTEVKSYAPCVSHVVIDSLVRPE